MPGNRKLKHPRLEFIDWLIAQENLPYIYDGKGPEIGPLFSGVYGYDCSGLYTDGIYNATSGRIDWRRTHNANKLHDVLRPLDTPIPGCAVFYGHAKNLVGHVMTYMPDTRVFGACGGNPYTKTPSDALKIGARVRYRPSIDYRPDFISFGAFPIE